MLDGLGGSEQSGVESGHPAKLLHDFRAFVGDAVDRLAGLSGRRLANDMEDAVEAFDLSLGLAKVFIEGRSQLFGLRRRRDLGKRLDYLRFWFCISSCYH